MASAITIPAGSTILFQGDSITDASRDRAIAEANAPAALGVGYCNHIAARLLRQRPADDLRFYNRGVAGNRIVDLYARWKADALKLKPDLISILIGVNDTWHELESGNGVDPQRYETIYRLLLDDTRRQLPAVQLVLGEPFVLCYGVVTEEWAVEMEQRRQIVRGLAAAYGARLVPFQAAMDAALGLAPAHCWVTDGVHPTLAGHRVLAECWYEAVVGG